MQKQLLNNNIIDFINHFNKFGQQIINCFTNGNCYWFAFILNNRFNNGDESNIYYSQITGHFITKINNNFYDITGKVIFNNTYENLKSIKEKDILLYNILKRDCINFKED